jgi:glycosyltransferase involved in cell wall biosynthesis
MLADWHIHKDWAEPVVRTLERFGDRVSIRPNAPLSEVQAVTRRAAIALTPSRVREGLSLSALEAHAAGAALISSGRGGLREASGPHAIYIDPDRPAVLAEAIIGLIDDPDRRRAIARAGQAHVARVHSPAARAGELDVLRASLLDAQVSIDRWPRPPAIFGGRLASSPAPAG